MHIETYNPLDHARPVYELWQANIGDCAPLTERMFQYYTSGRLSYDEGDGAIARCDGKIVGFGIIEIDRLSTTTSGWCAITALIVDGAYRRQGIGRAILAALESRLRTLGFSEMQAGQNNHALWPAIPLEPAGITDFFEQCGFTMGALRFDLHIPLADWQPSSRSHQTLKNLDVQIESLTPEFVNALLEYSKREFQYWIPGLLRLLPADMENILIVRKDSEIIGSVLVYTPQSRLPFGGAHREAQFDRPIGAIGAVGIAEAYQGKGLGRAMCETAMEHIKSRGGTLCYIEQVEEHIVPFYEKIGAQVCGEFRCGSKRL